MPLPTTHNENTIKSNKLQHNKQFNITLDLFSSKLNQINFKRQVLCYTTFIKRSCRDNTSFQTNTICCNNPHTIDQPIFDVLSRSHSIIQFYKIHLKDPSDNIRFQPLWSGTECYIVFTYIDKDTLSQRT